MTADTIGGVWTYTMALCEALREYDAEVHLLTMGRRLNESQHGQLKALNNVFLYESNFKLEWMEDPWEDVAASNQWISSIYEKVVPDIMHFNNYVEISKEWNCNVITVFHSCVHTWFRSVKRNNAPENWERYRKLLTGALTSSDVVVFPSFSIRSLAEKVHGHIPQSQVIYNGASLPVLGNVEKQPFIMSAGRLWDEAKNMAFLCDVAGSLSWPLIIAGSNTSPDGKSFEADNVQCLGELPHDEVLSNMQQAGIFTSAAVYEPFGLAILEAAVSGCALVLNDIPIFRELWGDAAVYFDPDDKEAATTVLQLLIDDDALRLSLSEKARQKAVGFTASAMAENYMALYGKLMAGQQQLTLNT